MEKGVLLERPLLGRPFPLWSLIAPWFPGQVPLGVEYTKSRPGGEGEGIAADGSANRASTLPGKAGLV